MSSDSRKLILNGPEINVAPEGSVEYFAIKLKVL